MEFHHLTPDDARIRDAYPVLHELRTELTEEAFVELYSQAYAEGYRVVGLFDEGECRAVAGYHLTHGFLHGRFMYIDDLVTADRWRSNGYGRALNDYLVTTAKAAGCSNVQLDSGTQRTDAHRFYFREDYVITSFHFLHKL
jgi:predicted GNAT superfamily acetyltransferase